MLDMSSVEERECVCERKSVCDEGKDYRLSIYDSNKRQIHGRRDSKFVNPMSCFENDKNSRKASAGIPIYIPGKGTLSICGKPIGVSLTT